MLAFNIWGTLQSALRNPPGLTTQFNAVTQVDQSEIDSLIEFLEAEAEYRGYTNYWVAYPLAFLSDERMIFVPRLPYHIDFRYAARDDRYAPYGEMVERSTRSALITTHHPELDRKIRDSFGELGVAWNETSIGDFMVFYDLQPPIGDIGLLNLTETGAFEP